MSEAPTTHKANTRIPITPTDLRTKETLTFLSDRRSRILNFHPNKPVSVLYGLYMLPSISKYQNELNVVVERGHRYIRTCNSCNQMKPSRILELPLKNNSIIYNLSTGERHKVFATTLCLKKGPQILTKYEIFTTLSQRLRADRETFPSLDLKAACLLNSE